MANTTAPRSARFKGWYYDGVNNQLEYWFNGVKVGHIDATGQDITNDTTTYMSNSLVGTAGQATAARQFTTAATGASLASNGAGASISGLFWAPTAAVVIDNVIAVNISGSDVTVGTATSSASYRRVTLHCATNGSGTGTDIVASLNATASQAAGGTRAFTIAASTIPVGAVVMGSQLTVGADTADGTTAAARVYNIIYHYV